MNCIVGHFMIHTKYPTRQISHESFTWRFFFFAADTHMGGIAWKISAVYLFLVVSSLLLFFVFEISRIFSTARLRFQLEKVFHCRLKSEIYDASFFLFATNSLLICGNHVQSFFSAIAHGNRKLFSTSNRQKKFLISLNWSVIGRVVWGWKFYNARGFLGLSLSDLLFIFTITRHDDVNKIISSSKLILMLARWW